MKVYRKKKVWLNIKHTKYCWVRLYRDKYEMQCFYKDYCDRRGNDDKNHFKVFGVSLHYIRVKGKVAHPETGIVLLCVKHTGAGVVSHELLHAVLWAHKHHARKQQYPIVIKNIKDEEELLHNHSYAINQFYTWYWKIIKD